MSEFSNYWGIDISKDFFDVVDRQGKHAQFKNNNSGFEKFRKILESNCCCVMEATGIYHQQLAQFLFKHKFFVAVINPLVIRRFMEMNLRRLKTDKADAQMICLYAQKQTLPTYKPTPQYLQNCRVLFEHIELLTKNRTMIKNRLHAVKHQFKKPLVALTQPLTKAIDALNKQIKQLEKNLYSLIKKEQHELFDRLLTIPGVGKKTAVWLLMITEAFTKFESAKQLICFVGLSPTQRTSGSSIRGKAKISKKGNPTIRKLLFMCSFNAKTKNQACANLYQRILQQGKCKKIGLIAVANKLIKQAFAIAKSGQDYQHDFISVRPLINSN